MQKDEIRQTGLTLSEHCIEFTVSGINWLEYVTKLDIFLFRIEIHNVNLVYVYSVTYVDILAGSKR